jgi:adenylate cyclase
MNAAHLVELLNSIFSDFDDLCEDWSLEKIKTIGDAYLLAAGIPEPISEHALKTVMVGLEMAKIVPRHDPLMQVRIGVHTGQVYGGLLGEDKLIFGP